MQCTYFCYLKKVIEFCYSNYNGLFAENEKIELARCLKLSDNALCLLSRIILRRHVWLKAVSFQRYIYKNDNIEVVANAVNELKSAEVLDFIDSSTPFAVVWDAILACFNAEDLFSISKIIANNKLKVSSKFQNLNMIFKAVTTQKTMFGQSLKDRLAKVVSEYLRSSAAIPQLYMIVRVQPALLELIRRCQRLYQISSITVSTNPSGTGTLSMSQPSSYNVPLLVAFNRLRFCPYEVSSPTVNGFCSVFTSRRSFLHWEAATELIYTAEMLAFQGLVNEFTKYKVIADMKGILSTICKTITIFDFEPFVAAYLNDGFKISNFLDPRDFLTGSIVAGIHCDCTTIDCVLGKLQCRLLLLAPLCMVSYAVEQATVKASTDTEVEEKPDFMAKFDAGTVLAYQCADSAAYFEKMISNDYVMAILIYELLLTQPCMQYKRGHWYKRLCIDYEHLKLFRCSLRAAYRCVLDPNVLISDKTELVVKIEKLTNKIKKQTVKGGAVNWNISADFQKNSHCDDRAVNLWLLNQLKSTASSDATSNELLHALLVSTIVANFVPSTNAHGESCRFVDRFEHHPTEGIEVDKSNGRWPLVGSKPSIPNTAEAATAVEGGQSQSWTCSACTFINARPPPVSSGTGSSGSCVSVMKTKKEWCEMCGSAYKPPVLSSGSSSCLTGTTSSSSAKGFFAGTASAHLMTIDGTDRDTAIDLLSSDDEKELRARAGDNYVDLLNDSDEDGVEVEEEQDTQLTEDNIATIMAEYDALTGATSVKDDIAGITRKLSEVRSRLSRASSAAVQKDLESVCSYRIIDKYISAAQENVTQGTSVEGDELSMYEQLNIVFDDASMNSELFTQRRQLSSLGLVLEKAPIPLLVTSSSAVVAAAQAASALSEQLYYAKNKLQRHIDSIIAASTLNDFPPPETFTVQGRRFGETWRKGKSKFFGVEQNGERELVSVEGYVLQKCFQISADDLHNVTRAGKMDVTTSDDKRESPVVGVKIDPEVEVLEEVKEGTPTKASRRPTKTTKDIDLTSYLTVVDGGGWQGWHVEGSPVKTLFGLLMWDLLFDTSRPGLFITAYQDGPLDLGYASFNQTRGDKIAARLAEIHNYSISDIIEAVGKVYRAHYRETCRGVNWSYAVSVLQLVAVCIGGPGLAAICRAYTADYKQFSAGAPDLLLLRLSKRTDSTPSSKLERVSLEVILGPQWASLGDYKEDWQVADLDLTSLVDASVKNRWKPNASTAAGLSTVTLNSEAPTSAEKSSNVGVSSSSSSGYKRKKSDDGSTEFLMDADDLITEIENAEGLDVTLDNALTEIENQDSFSDRPNPYVYTGEDLNLSVLLSPSQSNCRASIDLLPLSHLFEVMFVEVKGPNDHLAYRQLLWLHVLDQRKVGLKAVVCHVKE